MAIILPPKNEESAKSILYLAETGICETCLHKEECNADYRDYHLQIEILRSFESQNVFYAGYYCIGNRKNNVPYTKGVSEHIFFPHYEKLEDLFEVHPL